MSDNETLKKAKITISHRSDNKIWITIYDVASRTEFAEIQLELENYALAISGLSRVEGNLFVKNLGNIGKKKIGEKRQLALPDHIAALGKPAIKNWLEENYQEEGWTIDTYLGAQNSIMYNPHDMSRVVNYSVFKYEDAEGPE